MLNLKIVLPLFLCLSFLNCTKKKGEKNSHNANILNFAVLEKIASTDPATSFDGVSTPIVAQIYEPLYQYAYLERPYKMIPALAEEMPTISPDGLEYIIKIKKNIFYHQGPALEKDRQVRAKDFVVSFKRQAFIPVQAKGWWALEGRVVGLDKFRELAGSDFQKFKNLEIEGVQALDDYTLKIRLNRAYPQLLYFLALDFIVPQPMEAIEYYQNNLDEKDIGTGPFYQADYKRDVRIQLKKFPRFREEFYPGTKDRLPFIDEMNGLTMVEPQTMWTNFLAGKIDLIERFPKDSYSMSFDSKGELRKEMKEMKIKSSLETSTSLWWLGFNMRDKVVGKDKFLRYAIASAINRDEWLRLFTNNVGIKANSIYAPGIFGYDSKRKLPLEYNLEKAREYLKKSQYKKGQVIQFDIRSLSSSSRQLGEFIQNNLKEIGVTIQVNLNTFPAYIQKSEQGSLQFFLDGWSMDYPDAENLLMLLYSKNFPGQNSTGFNHATFDKKYEELATLSDGERKATLMREMEDIVEEDLPWFMVYYQQDLGLHYDKLQNYRFSLLIHNTKKYWKIVP